MTDSTADRTADDSREHELVAQCIDAHEAGGPEAVAAILAANPDLAPRLRQRLQKLEQAGLLPTAAVDEGRIPEQLGEYRLLRRIGSGGMGVVYLAEQGSLGRTVALKLVRPEQRFFPGARARFRREVEAIARLGDAGIVPIHAVGEDQGIDFFTMEYVRGASLADLLASVHATPVAQLSGRDIAVVAAARAEQQLPAQLPELFLGTWVQACCRMLARMARSVHHAHERGVVHRDLKPNNAMVTPDGRVLLLDFGLASAEGSARITRSGAVLGTLHYMAPEQLLDHPIDARTDVYALGVTLYELLALAPPYHAGSGEALRHEILHGAPVPLPRRNREVPRDVATIVEVALDRDPKRRYPSALALAEDLERFLQHRPIQARPIGPWLRLRRGCQRHPALATASGLLLLALLSTPLLVRLSRGDADQVIESAQQAARANLQSAIDATVRLMEQARSGALRRTPGLDAERLRQGNLAAELMAKLRRENAADATVSTLFVNGMIRVAELRRLLGHYAEALSALDEATVVWRELQARAPGDARLAEDHNGLRLARASTLTGLGQFQAAAQLWQQIVDEHAEIDPGQAPHHLRQVLSTCHNNLGRMHFASERPDLALAHLQQGLAIDASLPMAARTLDHRLDTARSRLNLGAVFRDLGRIDDARACYDAVTAELRGLAAESPDEPEVRRELARAELASSKIAARGGDEAAAAPLRDAALDAMQKLVAAFPERVTYRHELAMMAFEAATDLHRARQIDAAQRRIALAIEQQDLVLANQPDHPEHSTELATFLGQRGTLLLAQQQLEAALTDLRAAADLQQRIATAHPADPHYAMRSAALLQELAMCLCNQEDWPAARTALQRARDTYEELLGRGHAAAAAPQCLPKLLAVLAQIELMCDDFEGVVRALRRHQDLRPMPPAWLRDVGQKLHVDERPDFRALLAEAEATAANGNPASGTGTGR